MVKNLGYIFLVATNSLKLNESFVYEFIGEKVLVLCPESSEVFEISGQCASLISEIKLGKDFSLEATPLNRKLAEELLAINILVKSGQLDVPRRVVLHGLATTALVSIATLALPSSAHGSSTGGGGGGGDSTPPPDPEISMATTPLESSIVVDGNDPGA